MQVKCLNTRKPRCLSLEALDWEDSQLMRPFRDCGLADGFMKVWKVQFACNINEENGVYSCRKDHKRQTTPASSPATLLPASKRARLEENEVVSASNDILFDECKMDEDIKKHFLGKHLFYHLF